MHLTAMKDKEKDLAHQEIQILKKLKSLFIVEYIDSFLEDDELIIIMEYCECSFQPTQRETCPSLSKTGRRGGS